MTNPADTIPIFLVGTQRSGTTLLCRMLTAHPKVFVQNEVNVRKVFCTDNPYTILENLKLQIHTEQGSNLDTLLDNTGKTRWGLKDPELTNYLHLLEQFLPDTRFIVIIRDGRAVVRSYMENRWGLGTNAYTGAERWVNEVNRQLEFAEKHPEQTLIIRYEDLVENPELQLRSICDFLQMPYDMKMLEYHILPAHFERGRENTMTFNLPNLSRINQWKSNLSLRQKRVVAHVAGDTLARLGYCVEENAHFPGVIEKYYYRTHQKILGELQIQYRWRWGRFKDSLMTDKKRP